MVRSSYYSKTLPSLQGTKQAPCINHLHKLAGDCFVPYNDVLLKPLAFSLLHFVTRNHASSLPFANS